MKAVILAAGAGRRMAPAGWDKPKCLLHCQDDTLLDNILTSLAALGIQDVAIVVGYQRDRVERQTKNHQLNFTFVFNEEFLTTNTIHSLYLAREHFGQDFLYFNADVWFERDVLSLLVNPRQDATAFLPSLFVADEKRCGGEEVKVIVDENLRITRIGKELRTAKCFGEFIGIARIRGTMVGALTHSLLRYNEELGLRDLFFEAAIDDVLSEHVCRAVPLGSLRAIEIDTPQDHVAARKLWRP